MRKETKFKILSFLKNNKKFVILVIIVAGVFLPRLTCETKYGKIDKGGIDEAWKKKASD